MYKPHTNKIQNKTTFKQTNKTKSNAFYWCLYGENIKKKHRAKSYFCTLYIGLWIGYCDYNMQREINESKQTKQNKKTEREPGNTTQ